jgi:hypothetical protein
MKEEFKFVGGKITLRHEGSMYDQKTGKKTEWGRGLKISGGTKTVTIDAEAVLSLSSVMADKEVMAWLGLQTK